MIYIFLIFIVEVILFYQNYISSTYLIGWDNIMPEFNLFLNLKRSLFSVWQEYRGLGLLDGMSHASNLFHTLFISFFSLFLPINLLRWIFIFLTHFLGGIGFFYLVKKLFKNEKSAFLGALFYMFNLGIIQMYSAPLEVFAIHFSALPLVVLAIFNFLEKPNKKNSFFLFFTSLLTTPQSFVPSVFIGYFILVLFILFFDYLKNKNFKNIFIAFLIIIATNFFWLLPFLYSVKYNSKIIQESRINQYSSERIYLRNKSYGDIKNILNFKGFMMETFEFNSKKNKNDSIMTVWIEYSKKELFFIGYLLIFLITLLATIKIIKDVNIKTFPFLSAFFISFFFLANNALILKELNNFFRSTFPILGEAFRFPFTKFITLFAFSYGIIFSFGLTAIFNKSKKLTNIIFILLILLLGYLSFPAFRGYFISPFMKQKIPQEYFEVFEFFKNINENKRVAFLPTPSFWNWEYRKWGHVGSGFLWYGIPQPILLRAFDPWSHHNEQFYNEIAYAQKYESFDLFNKVLEKYNIDYLLLDTSIINNLVPKPINYKKIEDFLEKNSFLKKVKKTGYLIIYKVNLKNKDDFVSIIKNPMPVFKSSNFYYIDTTFLEKGNYFLNEKNPERIELFSGLFSEKKQEDQNFRISLNDEFIIFEPKNNLFSNLEKSENFKLVIPSILNSYLIPAKIVYEDNQLIAKISEPIILIDNLKYFKKEVSIPINTKIKKTSRFYLTETNQNFLINEYFYLIKDYPNTLKIIDDKENIEITEINLQKVDTNSQEIEVIITPKSQVKILIPKIKSIFSYENLIKEKKYLMMGDKKDIYQKGDKINVKSYHKAKVVFGLENLPHQNGYLILIKNHWQYGLPLDFYVDNYYQKRSDLEGKLSKRKNFLNYFLLPPTEKFYSGYSFHIVADPISGDYIENIIEDFSLYPIPYEFLTQIRLEKAIYKNEFNKEIKLDFESKKKAYFLYEISNLQITNLSLVEQSGQYPIIINLSQSYHPGWKAYIVESKMWNLEYVFPFLFGKELKEHVLVNNWANGWRLSKEQSAINNQQLKIIILFLPQYLQFLGFAVLILVLVYIAFFFNKKSLENKN